MADNPIAGEWGPAITGQTYERSNPAAPSEPLGHFPDSGRADVDDELRERLLERMSRAVIGDPTDPRTAELARWEVFGPVASLFCFATLDEALACANGIECGLSAAIFTSALATAQRFVGAVQAGVIHVDSTATGVDVYVPFGGSKASGWGAPEQGRAAIEFYTDVATVYLDA